MSLETQKFVRKPFDVEAVQVTEENFDAVVEWTAGQVEFKDDGTKYIRVRVHQPMNPEQTRAYIGDWVLYSRGFKVYKDKAFRNNFVTEGGAKTIQVVNNVFNGPKMSDDTRHKLQTIREAGTPVNEADQISGKRG